MHLIYSEKELIKKEQGGNKKIRKRQTSKKITEKVKTPTIKMQAESHFREENRSKYDNLYYNILHISIYTKTYNTF